MLLLCFFSGFVSAGGLILFALPSGPLVFLFRRSLQFALLLRVPVPGNAFGLDDDTLAGNNLSSRDL